jgi:eukaryotic-like serine/threonine-protein kinase
MPAPVERPVRLGRYALFDGLAAGGMASVHIGRLLGPVGFARTVAIKRMHQHLAKDPAFVSMFVDEARLAARIRHPNVVSILDVVASEGELFLVMELVNGESLAQLLRVARSRGELLRPDVVAGILVGALHGLQAAHDATSELGEPLEVVHRDVSPQNILVGIDGVSRMLDFGIAKAVGRLQETTSNNDLKGKVAYLAPEQLEGTAARTTDVYAASVVLWEALAGRRLFQGESDGQVLHQIIRGCDTPPSAHVPSLARALDDVTMRGLSVDPAKRFPTAKEMARALEAATPIATASSIGDWVEATAGDMLKKRAARVAAIEGSSSSSPYTPTATPAAPLKDLSLVPASATPSSLGPGRRIVWGAGAGALVLVAAIGVTVARRPATPLDATGSRSSAPILPPPETAAVPSPRVAETSEAGVSAPALAAAPLAPVASSRPRGKHVVTEPPAAPSASASTTCTPPWYFDARGARVFKSECL